MAMSQPAVSKHLRVLRDAGLVSSKVDAQRRVYSIEAKPLAEIDAWVAKYRPLWTKTLDALEAHLNNKE
jgi:DNA-binding transcriptional ArsR family regulator